MIFTIIDDYTTIQETNFYQFYRDIETHSSNALSKPQFLSDDEVLRNFREHDGELVTESTVSVLMYNSLSGETTQVYSKYKGWLK